MDKLKTDQPWAAVYSGEGYDDKKGFESKQFLQVYLHSLLPSRRWDFMLPDDPFLRCKGHQIKTKTGKKPHSIKMLVDSEAVGMKSMPT